MKYIAYILILLADIVVIVFFIMFEQYLLQVLLLHTLLFFVSWKIFLTFDSEVTVLPYYMLFFMPILGIAIFFVLYGSLHYFVGNGDILNDYEQMLSEKHIKKPRKRVDYASEIKTMSYIDMFSFINAEQKKDILIESQYSHAINNAQILAKGLESEDKEVQHYSATLLNSKENQFTETISSLREAYETTDTEIMLDALIAAYYDYIHSSFIGEESRHIFKKEYVDLLLLKIQRETYDLESLHHLFVAFMELDDYYHATLINTKIEEEFGNHSRSILNTMHMLYKKGYITQLVDALNTLEPIHFKEEPKLQELYDFFAREAQ